MFKFRLGTAAAVSIALAFGTLGCGGSAEPQKEPESAASIDPFGVGSVDLHEGAESGDNDDEEYMDDLRVPGEEYGKKSGGKKHAKAKCPKGKAGKKCRADAKKAAAPIPDSDAIEEQMEGIPWGLHYRGVMKNFENRIDKEYAEELKAAAGAVEEYDVRTKLMREKKKLKKSYVEFNGQTTGYEGAVLEGEFTHNNNESMLEWDADKFVEYLFFFNGRFWKRLRTFRKEALNIPDFETYVQTLEAKFGEGKRFYDKDGNLSEVRWKNKDTYMTATDKSGFYGVFCLYFTARVTEDNLAKLRPNADRDDGSVDDNVSDMVQSVTSGDIADHNSAVLDSYTGQNTGGKGATIDQSDSVMGKKGNKDNGGGGDAPPPEESDDDLF